MDEASETADLCTHITRNIIVIAMVICLIQRSIKLCEYLARGGNDV